MTVFVDASGLYAAFDKDDVNHSRTSAAWMEWLREGATLVTNNYVVPETIALLQHRIGVAAVRVLHEDVMPLLQVDRVSAEQHRAGTEAVLAAAFCFDAHFREQGFATKPSVN
jgi:uncharacterized protein